jgi:hypothetical protein
MYEDYSIAILPFLTVVSSVIIALFWKLVEHVKHPQKKLQRKPSPQVNHYEDNYSDETEDDEIEELDFPIIDPEDF